MKPTVNIKGIRDGLLVTLGEGEWPELETALLEQMQQQAEFLKGASLTLEVGNKSINASEMGRLRDSLSDFGVSLRAVLSTSTLTENTAQSLGLATRISKPPPQRTQTRLREGGTTSGERAILIRRTLRSGVSLNHSGHVTLIGDVNPGAEIIATGSVIVWGRLKGVVHAGADGDKSTFVCALLLSPTQLRIAGEIAIPPKKRKRGNTQPEIAFLQDGQIIAEPWDIKPR